MIRIIEDGIEYVVEEGSYDGVTCEGCPAHKKCNEGSLVYALCYNAETHYCTSATPVQEEAKVYATHNQSDAKPLVGSLVLYWEDESWLTGTLSYVSCDRDDQAPFEIEEHSKEARSWFPVIMKLPTRSLTQAQIIEAHPDLEGVELVGCWNNG